VKATSWHMLVGRNVNNAQNFRLYHDDTLSL